MRYITLDDYGSWGYNNPNYDVGVSKKNISTFQMHLSAFGFGMKFLCLCGL